MKIELDIELEEVTKELVNHIDMSGLAKEVSEHIDTSELEIDYHDLANEIDYSNLHEEICYSDLSREICCEDIASEIMNNPYELVEKLSETSIITQLVNKAVEAKLEELAEAIAGKVTKKDNDSLKQAIITALAAL